MNELGLVSFLVGRSSISTKIRLDSIEWAIYVKSVPVVTASCFTVCLLLGPLNLGNQVCSLGGSLSRLLCRGSWHSAEKMNSEDTRVWVSVSTHSYSPPCALLYLSMPQWLVFKLTIMILPTSRGYSMRIKLSASCTALSTVTGIKHLLEIYGIYKSPKSR